MTKKLEWQPLWDAMDLNPELWIQTTEDMYWAMLECLPPRAQNRRGFLVGEPLRHTSAGKAVHACFKRVGNEFFAKNLTLEQWTYEVAP